MSVHTTFPDAIVFPDGTIRLVTDAAKRAIEGGFSGQCAGCGEDFRRARDAKCAQRRFDGGGCDGKGP